MTVRIHQAWWAPRVFPFVLVLGGFACYVGYLVARRWYLPALVFLLFGLVVAAILAVQLRRTRIVLTDGCIVFPEWREDDASELGVRIVLRLPPAKDEDPERVTRLEVPEIGAWVLDRGRIVITTVEGRRHGIGSHGLRPRDRERIEAWLKEKVGA